MVLAVAALLVTLLLMGLLRAPSTVWAVVLPAPIVIIPANVLLLGRSFESALVTAAWVAVAVAVLSCVLVLPGRARLRGSRG